MGQSVGEGKEEVEGEDAAVDGSDSSFRSTIFRLQADRCAATRGSCKAPGATANNAI